MQFTPYSKSDFCVNPLMFYYEITQSCDLVCKHCRASAQEKAAFDELSTEYSIRLIDQVASFPRKPNIVFTGGDPLKRADLFVLIRHAVQNGLTVALTPSATPLATREAFEQAKSAGVQALGISLDGHVAEVHDAFRGFEGSFDKTREMLEMAKALQIPVQVNTSITRRNFALIDEMAEYLGRFGGVIMWSVFFLVPVGRGVEEERIAPEEYEIAFEKLWKHAQTKPFAVKTTEAPHYRRFVLRQGGNPLDVPRPFRLSKNIETKNEINIVTNNKNNNNSNSNNEISVDGLSRVRHRAPLGVTDGRGIMFVSHNGKIYPAGFLPYECGEFPRDSVVDVYQKHPLFSKLQNPDNYKGNCGICEYRYVCGGSRARAFAVTGDPLESEPDCNYIIGQDPIYNGK
ncbi:MAG: TIGR04053 family radical SAM/SPASM domain-containing protein [Planctomycetaceae bacterium]|jgi:radical SAM protein|nr:TIGR04053 family radical SAM/SPASM domain-containing protein [Planctomycetaceae bacterium]